MAADYRARSRPRPTSEQRVCALEECDVEFTWRSTHPKQICCCKSHYMKHRYREDHPPTEQEVLAAGMKRCPKCQQIKSELEFSPSVRAKSGGHCRDCMRAYDKRWNAENRDKTSAATRRSRARRLLVLYGAPSDDIDVLLAEQNNACASCKGPAGTKGFHIDHDHEKHEAGLPSYRGILCHGCNVGLGAFEDDPVRMLAAIEYLRRSRQVDCPASNGAQCCGFPEACRAALEGSST